MSRLNIIENINNILYRSQRVAGIEYLQTNQGFIWQVVVMEIEKKKAIFHKTAAKLDSLQAVKEVIGKDTPVFLSINSRSVVHKKVTGTSGSDANALQQVFPNAALDDFYIQRLEIQGGEIVSIARCDAINQILDSIVSEGLSVLHLSFGPFPVSNLLPLLPTQDSIALSSHILSLQQQQISDFQSHSTPISGSQRIGETDNLENELLVAAAMAVLGLSDLRAAGIPAALITQQQSEFLYKKMFQALGLGVLGFFFIALLASYLLFSNYQTANVKLETQLQHKEFLLKQRDTLRAQYQRQSTFFGDNKSGKLSKLSFYADQLAASLPSTIQFTTLQIFPEIIDKNRSATEAVIPKYESSIIRIKGTCRGSVFYNNWKKGVQELFWVGELHNLHYQDLDEDTGAFELEIKVK